MKILALTPFLFASVMLGQAAPVAAPAGENHDLGYTDTPIIPGQTWHVHDPARPHPKGVTPGPVFSVAAPADAIVLFDGSDLSHWESEHGPRVKPGTLAGPAAWKIRDGALEVVPDAGGIQTKEAFGSVQLHVEWASPVEVKGNSQGRGNSGVILMGRYEVQVLDAWENPTYADGQAGSLYGQWPPLVNPARRPGEWNTYDIVFEAPKLEGDKVLAPAYVTLFYNGVLVQDHRALNGPTRHRSALPYVAQPAEDALLLQNHGNPVRFRNIWARRLN